MSVRIPIIQVAQFEIKPAILQIIQNIVQFNGLSHGDFNRYVTNFLEIYDTFKETSITDDAKCLRLFIFFLRDKVKMWLNSLALGTITTWTELTQKFLAKYFSSTKIAKLRNNIITFTQQENKSLCTSWEHFKDLLRKYPHQDLPTQLVSDLNNL